MGAARRYLPSDPVDFARSAVPLGLLVLAAAVPGLRAVVLVGARRRRGDRDLA